MPTIRLGPCGSDCADPCGGGYPFGTPEVRLYRNLCTGATTYIHLIASSLDPALGSVTLVRLRQIAGGSLFTMSYVSTPRFFDVVTCGGTVPDPAGWVRAAAGIYELQITYSISGLKTYRMTAEPPTVGLFFTTGPIDFVAYSATNTLPTEGTSTTWLSCRSTGTNAAKLYSLSAEAACTPSTTGSDNTSTTTSTTGHQSGLVLPWGDTARAVSIPFSGSVGTPYGTASVTGSWDKGACAGTMISTASVLTAHWSVTVNAPTELGCETVSETEESIIASGEFQCSKIGWRIRLSVRYRKSILVLGTRPCPLYPLCGSVYVSGVQHSLAPTLFLEFARVIP